MNTESQLHPSTLTGKYRLRLKIGIPLAIANLAAILVLGFAPSGWEVARTIALAVGMFAAGVISTQHMAIWEQVE